LLPGRFVPLIMTIINVQFSFVLVGKGD